MERNSRVSIAIVIQEETNYLLIFLKVDGNAKFLESHTRGQERSTKDTNESIFLPAQLNFN